VLTVPFSAETLRARESRRIAIGIDAIRAMGCWGAKCGGGQPGRVALWSLTAPITVAALRSFVDIV
jgi:hypothetical protein